MNTTQQQRKPRNQYVSKKQTGYTVVIHYSNTKLRNERPLMTLAV